MEIKISSKNVDITDAIHSTVYKKIEHIHMLEKLQHIDIKIDAQHHKPQKVSIDFHYMNKDYHLESEDKDFYSAMDLVIKKLNRQLVKIKETKNTHLMKH